MAYWAACGWLAVVLGVWGPEAARADQIRLSTGEVLTVQIIETTEQAIRFRHPVLGELVAPRSEVEVIKTRVGDSGRSGDEEREAPAKPQAAERNVEGPAKDGGQGGHDPNVDPIDPEHVDGDWKFKLTLAASSSSGNSDTANLTTKFTANRETKHIRTLFDASYYIAQSSADRTDNKFSSGLRNEWPNPESKWFYFADGRYDFDEFQSWEHRVGSHVGLGYKVREPPPWRLNLLAGVGAIKEFGSTNDALRPEGLLSVEGEWIIAEKQKLKFDSTLFPDLGDPGEFRWVNNAAWSLLIDETSRISLTAGLAHEYQSKVDVMREHNDLRVFAGIDWEF